MSKDIPFIFSSVVNQLVQYQITLIKTSKYTLWIQNGSLEIEKTAIKAKKA